ncbi:MAG: hypothetical protein QNJ45_06025 [Ardenticatenaceae bacterium]|nr:hypothetical protein [Ardenticatenaceae bacterium]
MFDSDGLSENDFWELQAYIDGELSPAAALEFEQRLETDRFLAAEYQRWLSLHDELTLENVPDLEPEIDFSQSVIASLEAEIAPVEKRFWPVVLVQVVLGILLTVISWPLLQAVEPRGQDTLGAVQMELFLWLNRLADWLYTQRLAVNGLFSSFELQNSFQVSPALFSALIATAAVGGLLWLLSVGYVLQTRDWRPVTKN